MTLWWARHRDPVGVSVGVNAGRSTSEQPISDPRQSASQLLAVIQHLPDVIFQCEKRGDGKIYWTLNEGRLAQEFHLTTDEVRDKPLEALFPPPVVARLLPEFEKAFQGEAREFTNELGGRYFKHFPQPVRGPDGRVRAVVGFITEVTALVKAEEAIRNLSELSRKLNDDLAVRVLELAQKNKELETFSYTVSHDLRTPLTILENYSHVLLKGHRDDLGPESAQALAGIQKAVTRMASLIENILRLSRVSRTDLNRQPVNLSKIVQEIVQELREREPEREVDIRISSPVPADADPAILRVALANLISNAWKFTAKAAHPRIEFGSQERGGHTTYFVRDNGVGFDMAHAGRLFHLFERLHPATEFQGTGIGLVAVQRAVQRHGGTVWAEGELDRGSTFFFTLGDASTEKAGAKAREATVA